MDKAARSNRSPRDKSKKCMAPGFRCMIDHHWTIAKGNCTIEVACVLSLMLWMVMMLSHPQNRHQPLVPSGKHSAFCAAGRWIIKWRSGNVREKACGTRVRCWMSRPRFYRFLKSAAAGDTWGRRRPTDFLVLGARPLPVIW